jgi:hypothetical protein
MIVSFYLLVLSLIKLLFVYQFARGKTFYFVFLRATTYFGSFFLLSALLLNSMLSVHSFTNDISNFLIPILDFFYYLIFLVIFILFVGKYVPSVSSKYFHSIVNILLFFSILYSFINIYTLFASRLIYVEELMFPFGRIIRGMWIIGPLFGAFYWSKLKKSQKKILILSTMLLLLLNIPSGRRSLFLFIIFFLIFWCWQTALLKKIILILTLFFFYSFVESYHREFKAFTNQSQSIDETFTKVFQSDQSDQKIISQAVLRVLHGYILIKPVYEKLKITEGVGLEPYKTAMYSMIPSKFLDKKPYPGSLDGNKNTAFEYLVNDIAFDQSWNMSEYPISLKFMWQGNYVFVLMSIIISIFAMITFYRISIFFRDRLVILPLLTVFPGDYNYFLPDLISVLQIFPYAFLPGFTILFFLVIIKYFSKKTITKKIKLF